MESLPLHLLNEIIFRADLTSLAMMRCTNRSLQTHISEDQYLKSEFLSRFRSGLLHISTYGSKSLRYYSLGDTRSPRTKTILTECRVLGSCSGLLLLSLNYGLCVANPLTKKFRFLNKPGSRFLPNSLPVVLGHETKYIGFAVYEIDRTTQGFKTVCITEVEKKNPDDETTYRFEINAGDSWRFSKTKITCCTSDHDISMRKPVYLDGSLHWIRNDGSIVAFNPETEQSRLILTEFPQELRALFAAGNNSLTLISAFKDVIYVYALENILTNPKWVLVRQIRNVVLDQTSLIGWNVVAYDGKCLVLRVETNNGSYNVRMIHGYDLRANKWGLMGSIPDWCDANGEFFQFTPSLSSSVIGLLDHKKEKEVVFDCDGKRISSLSSIMGLITDGISSEKMEKQVRKISVEEDKMKPVLFRPASFNLSDVERPNNKRQRVE